MKAAVYYGPGDLRIEERPVPELRPGTLLLAVRACAVCGSDLRTLGSGNQRIAAPRILGHEIAGEVVAVGAGVDGWSVGDRLSTGADLPCHDCAWCRSGRPNCCERNLALGYQFDGAFADYVLLDEHVLRGGPAARFGPELDFTAAALAEPLACCLHGYEHLGDRPAGELVIFGAGPIGLMLARLGRLRYGAERITIVEPAPSRLERARAFADVVIDPTVQDPVAAVLEQTDGRGADTVFTACPDVTTHPQALALAARQARINLFGGLPAGSAPLALDSNAIHYREVMLTGSHGCTPTEHARALGWIEDGSVPVLDLVTDRVDLDDLPAAVARAQRREALKVVVTPRPEARPAAETQQ